MLHLRLIVRGMQSEACACTRCESRYVRVSRRRGPWLPRLLSMSLFRCESCRGLFFLPRRFGAQILRQRDAI
jgi:hypothetical protein